MLVRCFTWLFLSIFLLLPSMGYSQLHGRGDKTTFEDVSKIRQSAVSRKTNYLPKSYSLKDYAPVVGNQGNFSTCAAWSCGYAARTISYNYQRKITNKDTIAKYTFSPAFLYHFIKQNNDYTCDSGAATLSALRFLHDTGILVFRKDTLQCDNTIDCSLIKEALQYKTKEKLLLSDTLNKKSIITDNTISKMINSIFENHPLIISLKYYKTLDSVDSNGFWYPNPKDTNIDNHSMCVVGYDSSINGGSFEVMNSWGRNWGKQGYFWLNFNQFIKYGNYAIELIDQKWTPPILNGKVQIVSNGQNIKLKKSNFNNAGTIKPKSKESDFTEYSLKNTFFDTLEFNILLNINIPMYVYILEIASTGEISYIFPNRTNIIPFINTTETIFFPSKAETYKISKNNDKTICFLYSKYPIDFSELQKKDFQDKHSTYKRIKSKLDNRLLKNNEIKFINNNDVIKFTASVFYESVTCFFIDF
jgi:hypothetical protein